jgi:MATE family multidrug resistance protein
VLVAVALSWPLMVVPTYLVWKFGYGVEPAWAAATVYLAVTAGVYVWRFLGGKWRTMTVIEAAVAEPADRPDPQPADAPRLPV